MSPQPYEHSDELLDELFSTMTVLGRTLAKQHVLSEKTHLDVTRMLVLRQIADCALCKAGDVAQFLGIKAPATSSLIDGLERDGLVVREHSAEDKRVVNIRLTDKGNDALRCAEQERRRIMRDRLGVLSDDDIKTLIRIQRQLTDAIAFDSE